MRIFTSFAVNPEGVHFETQEAQETVVLFLRQHVVVNIPWILIALLLLIAPVILLPVLFRFVHLPIVLPGGFVLIGTMFWYLAAFGFILASFLHWFFNIYIVTDERIVDIDFYYLLFKRFSEAELTKIQDISFTTGGIAATVFNYGNILVETAGELPNIEFEAVPQPEKIVATIRSLIEQGEGGGL
ncbi:PH domain-containing protein [Patescibacteria group bacterium]|nr:PH domain-containing protein [Patescibacteria group bacterium]